MAFLVITFSVVACSKKQETIAKTEIVLQDSLATGEVSDNMLDEFEYEADSLETEEAEN
ncbi:MAG TPA: hypothetical protein VNW99_11315 [Cytophagaceae bacterium]|nr:hypothetical protein [Cytophagaceae bacterium]